MVKEIHSINEIIWFRSANLIGSWDVLSFYDLKAVGHTQGFSRATSLATLYHKAVHLFCVFFVICICLCLSCSPVVTCWERADLLALLYVMFSWAFVTFLLSHGALGQVWYLIVSIPDLRLLSNRYLSWVTIKPSVYPFNTQILHDCVLDQNVNAFKECICVM